MKADKTKQKAKALELLQQLYIYSPYIKKFNVDGTVYVFESFGGSNVNENPELAKAVKQFEEKSDCLVYAVTHEYLDFGECYSFLCVSNYEENWIHALRQLSEEEFSVYAYVWNVTCGHCSEFGSVAVQSFGGGIKRICA